MIVIFRAIGRQNIHPLFPAQKQNLAEKGFEDCGQVVNRCNTSADITGHGLLSTGNRKDNPSVSASTR